MLTPPFLVEEEKVNEGCMYVNNEKENLSYVCLKKFMKPKRRKKKRVVAISYEERKSESESTVTVEEIDSSPQNEQGENEKKSEVYLEGMKKEKSPAPEDPRKK